MEDFQIKNNEIEAVLKATGKAIGETLPKGWGFSLLIFDFQKGKTGSMFYISNAQREDMIKAMKEFIHKSKKKEI